MRRRQFAATLGALPIAGDKLVGIYARDLPIAQDGGRAGAHPLKGLSGMSSLLLLPRTNQGVGGDHR